MQILIHTMNASLFPNVDPNVTPWAGPPPEIVTVQSLLYASLAISLFAAFLATLGKQWVSRYLRNRGGSTTDKSRDRQRKLDALERWHFHLVIESLPAMLQLALLLDCALSRYLWTISQTVVGVAIAMTLSGITSHAFFTLTAAFFHDCPFQTPPSLVIQKFILHHQSTFMPLITQIGDISRRFMQQEIIHASPTQVVSPEKIFGEIALDWESCRADARCIVWMLSSTTDNDMILSTVHFAADTTWYLDIADTVPPRALADLFLDCTSARRVIPEKTEQAISMGMALGSILSIRLSMEPENHDLKEVCERLVTNLERLPSPEPMFLLINSIIIFVMRSPPLGRWTPVEMWR